MKPSLKKYLLTAFILGALLSASAHVYAANTFDWKGTTSTSWTTLSNWSENGGTASTYPGAPGATTDIVNIGVSTSIATFTRQPVITTGSNYTIASLTFGNNNAAVGATGNLSLTIGSGITLTVSGTVLQMHSATGGAANSGGRTVDDPNAVTQAINTYINGPGTLHCNNLTVGDNTIPGNAYVNNYTNVYIVNSPTITIDNNFTINSVSYHLDADQTVISRNSDATVSFQSGTLTVTNQLIEQNTNPYGYVVEQYIPTTSFSVDIAGSANATLNLGGPNSLSISINGTYYCNNSVDFYNPITGTGQSTVNYSSLGNQQVYNYQSYPIYALDPYPTMYQNVSFGGSGTKTFDIGTTTLSGNLTLNPGSELVDLSVNTSSITLPGALTVGTGSTLKSGSGAISVTGAVTNSGTITLGTGNFSMANNFTNSGTFTCGSSTVIFNATATVLLNDSAPGGTTFNNVNFTSGNNAVLQSGTFAVASQGVMTLSTSGTKVTAGGGNLIFKSDVNGSATLAALPSGCQVNGTVTVQRYVSANRAYRLMSSPVNAGTTDVNGNNYYDVNYLLTNTVLTGTNFPNNGVSSKSGNPTLYLWRENLVPQYTTFLNSNFIGIADISNLTSYVMNDSNPAYTNKDIPVGNGYLFYYRGSINQSKIGALTTAGAAATTDTLNATGTINYGNITVHPWYLPTQSTLGWSTTNTNPTIQGINLVGNPYPSSIDWDQFSNSNASAAIYGPNVSGFSFQLIPTGQQGGGNYNVYLAGSGKVGTQGTPNSNVIASGEGFMVQALNSSASLTFTEAAKTNTVNTGSNLYMGKPVATNNLQYLRLQLALDTINTDGTIIRFNSNAKSTFDPAEDAYYRIGTGKVSLASLSSDNQAIAYNQLPLALKGDTIHLRLSASASGTYKINIKELVGIPQLYNVFLADAVTKDTTDLRKTSSYSFTMNTGDTTSVGSKRFTLIINQNPLMQYKLLTFTADQVGQSDHVQLSWTTVNEQNYTNFTVERSNDNGKTFSVVGGLVSTGAGQYGLVDKNAQDGDNIYRLKQEDFNSTITYSALVHVQITEHGNKDHFTCFPNPAINTINLSFLPKTQNKSTYDLKISNSSGIVVKYAVLTDTNWQGNVSSFLTGTYLIQVVDRNDNSIVGQTKFVKL